MLAFAKKILKPASSYYYYYCLLPHHPRSDDHSSAHGFDRSFYSHSKRDARTLLSSSQLESNLCIDNTNSVQTATTTTTPQFHSSLHRRPIHNNYHTSCSASSPGSINDVVVVRGRARDRHYASSRNGSYSTCVDR